MSNELNNLLNEALPRWAALTGTQLGSSTFSFAIGSSSEFQSYDLRKYADDLNASRVLDMSGTTTILLLRGLFEAYVAEKSLKLRDLLHAPAEAEAVLSELRRFRALITPPCCEEAVDHFRAALRAAAAHYGYDPGRLEKTLEDERALGELRLAASRSLDLLAVHQFSQGNPAPKPLQYNRGIFEFSSINSFVHALRRQLVSGITLALIRPENVYKAYFVLGLRNGETLTILTDFQGGAHPEYHNTTRRPDRRLEERARQHWFPYRLLDGAPAVRDLRRSKTALVPLDRRGAPIEEISNLEPPEFIWLTLLFDLVAARFGRDDHKVPALSYTGEMVVAPHALVEKTSNLVLTGQYSPLVLAPITVESATPELAGNNRPLGHNAWLEDRYRHRVPEILLDVVGERGALTASKQAAKLLPGEPVRWWSKLKRESFVPLALDPSYFGTAQDVERTRAWYARVNLTGAVQHLAAAEFAVKRELILSWYRKRLERNMALLWRAVALGELVAPTATWMSQEAHSFPARDKLRWKEATILQQVHARSWTDAFPSMSRGILFGAWDNTRRCFTCAREPPARAGVFTVISPDNPRALALLTGVPEQRLPWPLRHWLTSEPYTGNNILDRVDPQDWKIDDPWKQLELHVTILLSRRAYKRLRKEHGLPASVAPKEAPAEGNARRNNQPAEKEDS